MPKFGPCGLWYGWLGGDGNYHASWPVGDADKPAVLLHHGYTASRRNWERTAALLQTTGRYRVLLMECRGTGLEAANHVGPYNIQQYAADVVSLLDFLKLDTINFCGHSMGGGIGMTLALDYPTRLSTLVLMAAVHSDGWTKLDPVAVQPLESDRDRMMKEYRDTVIRPETETEEWFQHRCDMRIGCNKGHFYDSRTSMKDLRLGDRLSSELTVPTLVLAGVADTLLKANIRDFQRMPPKLATLHVLSRVGHDVAVQAPAETAACIDDFLTHGPVNATTQAARL